MKTSIHPVHPGTSARPICRIFCAAAILLGVVSTLEATSYSNAVDPVTGINIAWDTPSNWNPNTGFPGIGDDVTIDMSNSGFPNYRLPGTGLGGTVTEINSLTSNTGTTGYRITGSVNNSSLAIFKANTVTINSDSFFSFEGNVSLDQRLRIEIGTLNLGMTTAGRRLGLGDLEGFTATQTNLTNSASLWVGQANAVTGGTTYHLGQVNMSGSTEIRLARNTNAFNPTVRASSLAGLSGNVQVADSGATSTHATLILDGSNTASFSGTLTNGAASGKTLHLTREGSGTQSLGGANTYTGQTLITSGTLLVSGTHIQAVAGAGGGDSANGLYRVASGGTLGGTGRISGNGSAADTNMVLVQAGGILAPGASIGTLTLDGLNISGTGSTILNMASGAQFSFELAGDGSSADRISFWNYGGAGDFVRNNNVINLSLLGTPDPGTYTVTLFDFFSNSGTTPTASGISDSLTLSGASIDPLISSASLLFNTNDISLEYTVIPEPATAALLLLEAAGIGLVRRRRARAAQ